MKIHEMLTEDKWTKREGLSIDGKRRCAVQQICLFYAGTAPAVLRKFAKLVAPDHNTTDFRAIANWNDLSNFIDVKEAFRKADL